MKIGLTGGIGAGKSTALAFFKQTDCIVFDADDVVNSIYHNDKEFCQEISKHWQLPNNLSTFELKKSIAKIVFNDKIELEYLEKLLHSTILMQMNFFFELHIGKIIICAIPLLFEKHWQSFFDFTVTISVSKDEQQKRLLQRGWNKEEIEARLKNQMSMLEKEELADFVIHNCADLDFLFAQCKTLLEELK